jgi:hypothetical protein
MTQYIIEAITILAAIAAVFSTFLKFKIYQLTKSKAMFILLGAMIYASAVRIALCFNIPYLEEHSSWIITPFWIIFGIGCTFFYRSLKDFIKK